MMQEIKDTGKVWIRGQTGTAFAIKVNEKVFVPGQEEGQSIEYWLEENLLCVDLHNPAQAIRIARQFPLDMEATHPASLFNGFKNTKHADIKVITYEDAKVAEKIFKDNEYVESNVHTMSRDAFWKLAGFPS
jgi:hypothetical protein